MNASQNLPWPGWEIVRRLGGGSYGKVYEIRREQYHIVERAALKVISFPSDPEEVEERCRSGCEVETLAASYRRQMERVLEEYSLMMQLKRNPNVVLCDTYETVPHADGIGWDIYIRMELLTPLKKYLGRVITLEQTIRLGEELCNALIACREKDIIHRDIKPDNILMTETGAAKLGDFGIAKIAEKTMAGTRTGTPGFIAPEVFHNEPYGKSVDIYSLGMVLYWMLNRRTLPFLPLPPEVYTPEDEQRALQRRMQGEALPRPADGSRALQDVVLKACAYRPEDRYATPEAFCRALEAAYAADTGMADTLRPAAPPREQPSNDADATMGNNWETGSQTEAQPELTDFDATDATMGTCGTMPDAYAQTQPSGAAAPAAGKTDESYDFGDYGADASNPDSAEIAYDEENEFVKVSGIMSHSALQCARRCMRAHNSNYLVIRTAGGLSREIMMQIGSFTDVDYLELTNSSGEKQVLDITPLSNMTNLKGLDLRRYSVPDYSFLSNLTNLTTLFIDNCVVQLPDLTPLSNLTSLTSLYFGDVGIHLPDLTPLSGLKNLENLWLFNCFASDLTPLDLTPLSDLTNLTRLACTFYTVSCPGDLTPLSSLTNLMSLCISGWHNLSVLTPLSSLTNLTELDLTSCKEVSDLSPLSALTNLTRLDLQDCIKVSDLSPLSSLKKLEILDIRGTNVKSLHGLENARNLQRLNASKRFRFNTRALEVSGCMSALRTN